MSIFHKMSLVFQAKANAALNKAEDPAEALDLAYEKMLEQLQKVRASVAEVLTAEKRQEQQHARLVAQGQELHDQARQALVDGQEDLARTQLERAQIVAAQIDGLLPQIQSLKTQEQRLELAGQKLAAKIAAFRTQREVMKAQYSAAKATSGAIEGVAGLSEEMADVSMLLERTQDKVNVMQARAVALNELANRGVLDSASLGGGDDIDMELQQIGSRQTVDAKLVAMKAELAAGET